MILTITEDHIKLLRAAYIDWEDCEFGAPAIDCKRPYGNSSVYYDIAEILDIDPDAEEDFTDEQESYMGKTHRELQYVLQIFIQSGELSQGVWKKVSGTHEWDYKWEKIKLEI